MKKTICTILAGREDLTEIEGFESAVCGYLDQIRKEGSYSVMKSLISLD